MNPKIEASKQMDKTWGKMAQGPGIKFYLAMGGQEFKQIQDALKKQKLPSNLAEIPGIDDIVGYLRALNAFLA